MQTPMKRRHSNEGDTVSTLQNRIHELETQLENERESCAEEKYRHENTKAELDNVVSELQEEQGRTESLEDQLQSVSSQHYTMQMRLLLLDEIEERHEELRSQLIAALSQLQKYHDQHLDQLLHWADGESPTGSQYPLHMQISAASLIMKRLSERLVESVMPLSSPPGSMCLICRNESIRDGVSICNNRRHIICRDCNALDGAKRLDKCPVCGVSADAFF
jgi:hypothetical protein